MAEITSVLQAISAEFPAEVSMAAEFWYHRSFFTAICVVQLPFAICIGGDLVGQSVKYDSA